MQIVGADGAFGSRTDLNSWLSDAIDRDAPDEDSSVLGKRSVTLFLVDVCGAGQAARLAWLSDMDDERRQAWVLAGCQPNRPAFNGWFTQAMATVLRKAHAKEYDVHSSQRFIPLPLIAQNIRKETKRLCSDGYVQLVVGTPVDLAAEIDLPFFPNIGYSREAGQRHHRLGMVNLELTDFCSSVDELVDPWHFYERASGRGPEQRVTVGCFRGRHRELADLGSWLDGELPGALRVVTGSPGSGKSALLGMLVCSSHPELHDVTQHVWAHRRDELPSVNPRLVALHVRDQNLDAVLESLMRQLGLSGAAEDWSGQAVADALTRRAEPVSVVVDALDEAEDPDRVVSDLLDPLMRRTRPDGAPCCRLLVATRPWEQFAPLLSRARSVGGLIDLDDTPRGELEDALRSYVVDLLNGNTAYRQLPHRRARDSIASTVAGRLAHRHTGDRRPQWGEFLVAGLYANSLLQQSGRPVETADDTGWAAAVPSTLPEVLDLDLGRRSSLWGRPVLAALAFSRGQGMPRTVIQEVAPLFADPSLGPPSEQDVRDALAEVRFYLRRDMDVDGSILYRLFHQALVDHLWSSGSHDGGREAAAPSRERLVFERLLNLIGRSSNGSLYWEEAQPYLLRHMSEYAADCGLLRTLIQDPEFLVHAEPSVLGAHLTREVSDGHSVVDVYRASLNCLPQLDVRARRSVLALDAARLQMPQLARRISRPPRQQALAWQPRWATGAPWSQLPYPSLMGCTQRVQSVACGTVDGRTLVVSAGTRDAVTVWDLATGQEYLRLEGHQGPVNATECCQIDGKAVLVTAGSDRSLRLWDLASGAHTTTLTVEAGRVTSLACVDIDGRPVVVASCREGVVRAWDIKAETEKASLPGHQGPAWSSARVSGSPGLVATGGYDGSVRVWDLVAGVEHLQLPRHDSGVLAVAHFTSAEHGSCLLTGGSDGVLRVFGLATGRKHASFDCLTDSILAIDCVPAHGNSGEAPTPLGVVGGSDGELSVWDLAACEKRFDLAGHVGAVNTVACVHVDGHPVAVSGGDDGSLRVWDLMTGTQRAVFGIDGRGPALTSVDLVDGPVVVGADGGGLHTWDVVRGVRVASLALEEPVTALTSVDLVDGPVVVGADGGGLHTWDVVRGVRVASLALEEPVTALTSVELEDGPAVVGASARGLRVWRPPAGGVATTELHSADVDALAAARVDGRAVVVAAESGGVLRRYDVRSGTEAAALTGHRAPVRQVVCTSVDGRPSVVSAGRDGTVRLWDWASGHEVRALRVPADCVRALATAAPSGRPVVVIGASDGSMRLWDLGFGTHTVFGTRQDTSVRAVATITHDGRCMAASVGGDGSVYTWDLCSVPGLTGRFSHSGPAWSVACGVVDGRPVAATAGADGTIRTWDLLTSAETGRPITSAGTVWDVALTEIDGEPVLLTAGFDKTIGVISMTERDRIATLTGHQDSVDSIDVATVSGRLIAVSGSCDGTARVWDVAQSRSVGVICLPGPGTGVAVGPEASVVVAFDNDVAVLDCNYDMGDESS